MIDIKKYPEFLPWVLGLRVREHDFSARKMHAELAVGYKIYTERFTCNVSYETDKSIHVDYLKGPLKHLSNNWVFTDLKEGGCAVDFHVAFEFDSMILQTLAQQFFDKALKRMIGAFEKRAIELYGAT